jgi:hypothetical protein
MDISEDSSLMAAGFSDSQIRVWSLTGTFLYELKSNEELDDLEDSGWKLLLNAMKIFFFIYYNVIYIYIFFMVHYLCFL